MFIINDVTFRNLEEQVQKNKEDIAKHYAIDRALSNLGIEVVGQISTPEELPDPLTYTGKYGDAYAVGNKIEVDAGTSSYEYYVYTRPDPNSGNFDNYWLNVGKISIAGPQGPQGIQGEQGPEGKSSKWFTGQYQPAQGVVEGDFYLNNNGDVFQYTADDKWSFITNIKGPEGVEGPRGLTGPQGPAGEPGPQGAKGDVGGFINIAGQLNNAGQLPLPSELQNRTIAYLVGENKELYIQVGEADEDAVWVNVGPLNVATMVTVNGEYQNVWDADTKLDKITTTGNLRVYAITGSGTQSTVNVGKETATANWMPMYDDNGCLTANTPQSDNNVLTRKWYNDTYRTFYLHKFDFGNNIYLNIITNATTAFKKEEHTEAGQTYNYAYATNIDYVLRIQTHSMWISDERNGNIKDIFSPNLMLGKLEENLITPLTNKCIVAVSYWDPYLQKHVELNCANFVKDTVSRYHI